ncbi:unnamed protein product [Euphydryas editha]|uniref:Uncharacterized protein n=1 Tax=Euphydryas editha TaxID=104508 RepID=A0AAU9UPU8_EUPED|nr:unnamed protein product [Euphydryas editha]
MLQENGYIILNRIDNKFNTRETLTKKIYPRSCFIQFKTSQIPHDYSGITNIVESTVRNISDKDYNSLEYMIREALNSNKIQKIKIQNTLKGDWINRDIIEMITKRNQLWSASKANPDDD